MSETAIGLFEDSILADAVADALRAHGFPSSGIRIVAAQSGDNGNYSASANQDLRTMKVAEYESNAYVAGLGRGNALVYATGTRSQADEAVGIMNQYGAIEIEEFATAGVQSLSSSSVEKSNLGTVNPESRLPESQVTIGAHEKSYTTHSSRSKTEGARVFSW
jgi:hypothetical protein